MSRTKEQLLEDSIDVMNETEAEANSAGRIGGLLHDIAEHIGEGGGGGGNSFPTPSGAGYLRYNGSQYLWSNISINPSLNSGTQIATFNVNGQSGALYAPTASSGGGITLNDVWSSLSANDSTKQIHSSHLSSYMGNFTFWGNTFGSSPNTSNTLTGRIIAQNGIQIGDALLVYDSQNGGFLKVTTINNGAMNLCATGGVSALGMGSSGGGGGGGGEVTLNQPLSSINSSGLSAPGSSQNGKTLIWNNNNSYWEYGSFATESFVTSQGYLTAETDPTVPAWAKQPTKPSYSFSELTSHPTTLANYGINDAKFGSDGTDYVPITLGTTTKNVLTSHQSLSSRLALTGGTMTGQIKGGMSGMWVKGRDNALINQTAGNGTGWAPVLSVKTYSGSYELGAVSDDANVRDKLILTFITDSDYNNNVNNYTRIYFPTSEGTLALLTDNIASATKLQTARKLWGNNFDGTANIGASGSDASLNYVADINMSGNLTCQNIFANDNVRIYEDDEEDNWWWALGYQAGQQNGKFNIARYNSTGSGTTTIPLSINPSDSSIFMAGSLYVGSNIQESGNFLLMNYASYGLMVEGYANQGTLHSSSFGFHTASSITWSSLSGSNDIIMQLIVDTNRTFAKKYAQFYDGIRIGDGMLVWDGPNNAFQVIKSDGTAANLYTTGGVSTLGMSAGVSSIDAMTFGNLTVTNNLKITKNGYSYHIYGDNIGSLHLDGSEYVVMGNDVKTEGYSIYTEGGSISCGDGSVTAKRFYLDSKRYLYLDSNNVLRYYDNGTSKIIAFS